MTNLLKSFGKGCLYILVLPVLLVVLCIYAVLGVGMFLFVAVKGAILFFTGRNFGELEEDIKARAILEGKNKVEDVPQEVTKVDAPKADFASSYYVPLSQDIPAPKDNTEETPKEGGNE